jgi:hypothetical protein
MRNGVASGCELGIGDFLVLVGAALRWSRSLSVWSESDQVWSWSELVWSRSLSVCARASSVSTSGGSGTTPEPPHSGHVTCSSVGPATPDPSQRGHVMPWSRSSSHSAPREAGSSEVGAVSGIADGEKAPSWSNPPALKGEVAACHL